jgi:hypothetical protein
MTGFFDRTKAALGDRRVQVGAAATLAALAVCGLAVAGGDRGPNRQDADPAMADHARLAVLVQPIQNVAVPQPIGRLATLDPSQTDAARTPPEPVDPELQAIINQERREQMQAVAEQRAFDARIRGEMSDSYQPVPTEREAPTRPEPSASHWTSNTEDAAPGV